MVSGFRGRIPKHDAHICIYIYIYTSENSVTIICLALRRSATRQPAIVKVFEMAAYFEIKYCKVCGNWVFSDPVTFKSYSKIV